MLTGITTKLVEEYRDHRRQQPSIRYKGRTLKGATVNRELECLTCLLSTLPFNANTSHARERLWALAGQLNPNDSPAVMVKQNKLDNGKIEKLVTSLHSLETSHTGLAETLQIEANYFERNKERMRYPQFREQGFFVGSGVIEAGCKTILGRLKQSGMFWTCVVPMPSLPSAAASSAASSRIIGKFEGRKLHFKVAHPIEHPILSRLQKPCYFALVCLP